MLPPSARCLLLLLSLALVSRCHAVITQLPALSVYAGLGDFSSASSSTAGAIAVYGNANISNYAIGDLLPPAPAGKGALGIAVPLSCLWLALCLALGGLPALPSLSCLHHHSFP